ncbi:hypothetical protein CRBSH125_09130 [Afipia carboxidovorans]|nr:hypothetical protein CRBSH125_09130 [Afipia carboxidovorans]
MLIDRIPACLLQRYHLTASAQLVFENGYTIILPPGEYWTAAFGVVVDLVAHRCIAFEKARWKLR